MHRKSLILLLLSVSVGLSGCITSKSISNDINDTETQAYHDWKRQQAVADTLPADRQVNPDSYHVKQDQQPVVKGKLALMDAIKLALQYNRDIQTAVENTSYAHGRILQAYGGVVPTATLNGTYNRIDKVAEIDIGGNKLTAGSLNNYTFNLHIEQPIFNGSAAAGLRAAKLYNALTDKQVDNTTQSVVFGVDQSYYQLLLLQKTYQVNQQYLQVSKASLKDVQNKAKYGTATHFNVLRAEVDVANAQTQMIKSQNDLEQAQAAFFKLLGVSQNSEITLEDSLNYKPMNVNESNMVNTALHNNPLLASSLLTVRLNEQNVLASYSRYFPTVSAFLNQNYQYPNPHGSFFNPGNYLKYGYAWNAGITLKWSIFDLSREGTVVQDKSELRQQKISYLDTREQILYNVRSAVLALKNAERAVNAQKLTVQQAQEGLRLAQVGLQNGTLDQVSVLDSRQALRQAELSYYSSIYNHKVARLQLMKATGQLKVQRGSAKDSNNMEP